MSVEIGNVEPVPPDNITPIPDDSHNYQTQELSTFTRKQRLTIASLVCLLQALPMLDTNIIGVIGPTIATDLGQYALLGWVQAAYSLTGAAFTPLYTAMAAIYGRHICIQIGLAWFILGSIVAATAHTMTILVLGRALQGIGFAGLIALPAALIGFVTTPRQRGLYIIFPAMMGTMMSVIGPVVAGVLLHSLSWRWLFILPCIIQPITAVILYIVLRNSLVTQVESDKLCKQQLSWVDVDWLGSLIVMAATAMLMLGITLGGSSYSWLSPTVLTTLILSPILYVLFIYVEHRRGLNALMPLDMFKSQNFCISSVLAFMLGVMAIVVPLYLPQYYQTVYGDSPMISGLRITPFALSYAISAAMSGRFVSSTGHYKYLPIAGSLLQLSAAVMLVLTFRVQSSYWLSAGSMVVLGVGGGMLNPPVNVMAINSVKPSQINAAVTVIRFFDIAGDAIMSSVLTSAFDSSFQHSVQQAWPTAVDQPIPSQAINMIDVVEQTLGSTGINMIFTMSMKVLWYILLGFGCLQLVSSGWVKQVTLRGATSMEQSVQMTDVHTDTD